MRYEEIRQMWLASIQGRPVETEQIERLTAQCMMIYEKLGEDMTRDAELIEVAEHVISYKETCEELSEQIDELEDELEGDE